MMRPTRRGYLKNGCLLILMGALLGVETCRPPEEAFFTYPDPATGKEVHLFLSTNQIAANLFTDVDTLMAAYPEIRSVGRAPAGHSLLFVGPDLTEEEVLNLIDALNATLGVDWANPVVSLASQFHRATGFPSVAPAAVAPIVWVGFPAGTTREAVQDLAAQFGFQVRGVPQDSEPVFGVPLWYRFLLTEHANVNSLQAMELLVQDPNVIMALPTYYILVYT